MDKAHARNKFTDGSTRGNTRHCFGKAKIAPKQPLYCRIPLPRPRSAPAARDVYALICLAPSGEGIHTLQVLAGRGGAELFRQGGRAPSPQPPSPLRKAPRMPPGVKSLMASQVGSWPSFTSISFMSLRGAAAQRETQPGQRGREGKSRGHLGGPPHSPGGCAILPLLLCAAAGEGGKGRAAEAHGKTVRRDSRMLVAQGWRHVGRVALRRCWPRCRLVPFPISSPRWGGGGRFPNGGCTLCLGCHRHCVEACCVCGPVKGWGHPEGFSLPVPLQQASSADGTLVRRRWPSRRSMTCAGCHPMPQGRPAPCFFIPAVRCGLPGASACQGCRGEGSCRL